MAFNDNTKKKAFPRKTQKMRKQILDYIDEEFICVDTNKSLLDSCRGIDLCEAWSRNRVHHFVSS